MLATLLAGAGITALCIYSDVLDESRVGLYARVLLGAATVLGSLACMAGKRERAWAALLICCAAELMLLLCGRLALSNGVFTGFAGTLLTVCLSAAGAFGAIQLIGKGQGKRRYPHRYR